ncbi:hypothetical protein E2320_020825, partial [Naja naja]
MALSESQLKKMLAKPQSDLIGLIQVMIVVFGDEPPVFSRPTISASYPSYQATGPPNNSCELDIKHKSISTLQNPQSDLIGLIQVMIVVFGDEPPVFSRPTISASYPSYQATGPPNSKHLTSTII